MISQQVTDMLKMLIGRPGLSIITMEGRPEGDYLSFPDFRRQIASLTAAEEPAGQPVVQPARQIEDN